AIVWLFVQMLWPFRGWRATGRSTIRATLMALPIAAAVALHPALRTMAGIAAHNGWLKFGAALSPARYPWLAAFAIAVAVAVLWRGRSSRGPEPRGRVLASASLAAATLLLMQHVVLAVFGLGSDYAVSKHVFFL